MLKKIDTHCPFCLKRIRVFENGIVVGTEIKERNKIHWKTKEYKRGIKATFYAKSKLENEQR